MFKFNNIEIDENKLEGKAKVAYLNLKTLNTERSTLAFQLERNKILTDFYSNSLKENLPKGENKNE